MFKRIINGVFYVGLCGAIGLGLVVAASGLTSGPVYVRVVFAALVIAAFILGFKAEGGGADRHTDEETSGV